jgi:hypothetical protein
MTTPPPSARRHNNNNINKQHHRHSNKRYSTTISFILFQLLLLLATSTPTSSIEFQCISSLPPAFNDSFNPKVILDKILPASTSAMRAWTCHGRTHKEMVEKLKLVSHSQIMQTKYSHYLFSDSFQTTIA